MICRTRHRVRQTGEVFTPPDLVDEILKNLNERDPKLFTKTCKNFLDPAAGDGNILVRVLHFKLWLNEYRQNGEPVPVCRILGSIYGVDIMLDNVERCRERLLEIVAEFNNISLKMATARFGRIVEHNIVCHDGLQWDYDNWKPKTDQLPLDDLITFE